ncbi:MAG: hypothetical protein ACK5AN_10815, partial [Planctomyces sp.]
MLQFSFRQARRLPSLEKVFDGKTSLFNPGMLQDELSEGLNIIAKEQERRAVDVNPPVTVRARPASD